MVHWHGITLNNKQYTRYRDDKYYANRCKTKYPVKAEMVGGDAYLSSSGASEKVAITALVRTLLQKRETGESKAGSCLKQKYQKEESVCGRAGVVDFCAAN